MQSAFATARTDRAVGATHEAHGAAAAAAAAQAEHPAAGQDGPYADEDSEFELGGPGLVEAVFRGMFPDAFDKVVPVRNHKVSVWPLFDTLVACALTVVHVLRC